MHDESAVAQNTAFWSMPAAARIVGFNTIMLTQERKVVAPAINSVRRVVPPFRQMKNSLKKLICSQS